MNRMANAVCSDVVDYSFHTSVNMGQYPLTSLNSDALNLMSNPSFDILPVPCRSAIKKAICSNIYKRCASSTSSETMIGSMTSGAQTATIEVYLPYQRSCVNICNDFHSSCQGLLDYFDIGSPTLTQLFSCNARTELADYLPYLMNSSYYSITDGEHANSTYTITAVSPTSTISTSVNITLSNNRSYTFELPYVYDLSDNTSVCNAAPASFQVASSSEPYLYANVSTSEGNTTRYGACAGIVTDVYIPATGYSSLSVTQDLGVAPFSAPYVYQRAVEETIQTVLAALPMWLKGRCYASVRRLLCSTLMLAPESHQLSEVVLSAASSSFNASAFLSSLYGDSGLSTSSVLPANYSIHVPSFPDRALCTRFASDCGSDDDDSMKSLWLSNELVKKWLITTCDLVLNQPMQTRLFPSEPQTVMQLRPIIGVTNSTFFTSTTTVTSDIVINVTSSATTLSINSTRGSSSGSLLSVDGKQLVKGDEISLASWVTQCPHYFVVPDDPSSDRNTWIKGTGCSNPCMLGSDQYLKYSATLTTVAPAIGLPLIIIILIDMERERRREVALKKTRGNQRPTVLSGDHFIFIRITAYMSALGAVGFLLTKNNFQSPQEYYCLNNAVPLRQSDGVSTCVVQALIIFYGAMGIYTAWLAQCVFLFLRTVLLWKGLEKYYGPTAIVVAFLMPTLSTLFVGAFGAFGFPGNFPWCIYHSTVNQVGSTTIDRISTLYFFVIGAVFDVISLVCMTAVVIKYITWLSTASRKVRQSALIAEGDDDNTAASVARQRDDEATTTAVDSRYRSSWLQTRASVSSIARTIGPTTLFHVAFIMSAFAVLIFPVSWTLFAKKSRELNADWNECLFHQFYHRHSPPVEEVWKRQCGETPSIINRHGYGTAYWVIFCLSGQSLIMSIVLLPQRLMKWFEKPKVTEEMRRVEAWKRRMMSLVQLSPKEAPESDLQLLRQQQHHPQQQLQLQRATQQPRLPQQHQQSGMRIGPGMARGTSRRIHPVPFSVVSSSNSPHPVPPFNTDHHHGEDSKSDSKSGRSVDFFDFNNRDEWSLTVPRMSWIRLSEAHNQIASHDSQAALHASIGRSSQSQLQVTPPQNSQVMLLLIAAAAAAPSSIVAAEDNNHHHDDGELGTLTTEAEDQKS